MNMIYCCLYFILQLSTAASIIISQTPVLPAGVPKPADAPLKEMMEPGLSYLPQGAGCAQQPEWSKTAPPMTPAIKFKDAGWDGFCQIEWTVCPDAAANKDYSYYWRSLGPDWVKTAGPVDKIYCAHNGWLKPEFRAILHNFTALQQKGEEECATKWSKPEYRLDTTGLLGVVDAPMESLIANKDAIKEIIKARVGSVQKHGFMDIMESIPANLLMNEKSAHMDAAWNCAMGDVSCDIAYCNSAYCEKSDGTIGVMDECEGWDKVHNTIMPA